MQSLGLRRPTPVVGVILVILLVAFVAERVTPLGDWLALYPDYVLHGQRLWGLLTFGLVHDLESSAHLLFNGLAFYFFAPDLETLWGRRRFLTLLGLAQLGGAALVVLAAVVGLGGAPVVGFSAVVMGVVIAWGLTFPEREMFFFLFRLRGITLVYVTVGLEVLNAISYSRVSTSAHFGGMAAGALFALAYRGTLRRLWLKVRLRGLQAQAGGPRSPSGRRRGTASPFRVIQGGKDPPADKRYLN